MFCRECVKMHAETKLGEQKTVSVLLVRRLTSSASIAWMALAALHSFPNLSSDDCSPINRFTSIIASSKMPSWRKLALTDSRLVQDATTPQ